MPAVNVTVAVCVTVTVSVVSVAVNTNAPATVDFTVNVTTPDASLAPEALLIVGVPVPDVFASVTVFPDTGLLFPSFNVTVTVDVVVPSAVTELGDALTVDCAAVGVPAVNVTVAVCVTVTVSVVSVAVNTNAPATVDFTVNVTTPDASLAPEALLIVGVPVPDVLASATVFPDTALLFASFKVTVTVDVVVPSAVTELGDALNVD